MATEEDLQRRSRVFMDAADPIVICDLEGRIVDLNAETERVYGWSRDELLGRPLTVLVPPPRHESARALLERCVAGEDVRNEEGFRCSRSGVVYPALVTMSLLTGADGRPVGVATLTKHITKLRQEQARLARSEEKQRSLVHAVLDTAVEAIITISERGFIESVNHAARRMFGYAPEEMIGQNVRMLMPEPYRGEHDAYIRRYRDTGERKIIGIGREAVGRRKDGSTFPMHLSVSEVHWDHRRVFAGFVRDITELKEAEEELRNERDFAESLIETAQAIVLVLDADARIVRFNSYMEELSGYALDEVKGRDWFATFLPTRDHGRIRDVFRRTVEGGRVSGNVNPIRTKEGREREIAWWARTLRDHDGRTIGVLSVGHDVTELKDAQQRLLASERLAGIGEMITGLAHESRNALQRMQANLEMLALEVEDRPQALAYVSRIQLAQNYLSELYEEVRGYAAPIRLDRRACDLRRLWGASWADLALRRQDKDFELRDETGDEDVTASVDPFAMGQVFRNILDNAISACGDRGRVSIRGRATDLGGRPAVELSIRDDGPGFAPEQRERIFQPFFTTKTQGTGLGMAIVERIVRAHGGRIAVGEDGGGATIVLTLPRDDA